VITTAREPWLARALRLYLRSGARGSTRCTFWLAKHVPSLHTVPITINGHQRLYVNLEDGLSHGLLAGSPWPDAPWEVDEQAVMRRLVRPGDVVFDIGAHIGIHSMLLAELTGPAGQLHAFEPNAAKLPALQATIAQLANGRLHAVALGDKSGHAALYVPLDQSMSSLVNWTDGRAGDVAVSECDVCRLDDLVANGTVPRPDFVKCDVEGAEFQVLSGAIDTFDTPDAPIMLYEANAYSAKAFGQPIDAATERLRNFTRAQYAIFHVQPPGRLVPVDTLQHRKHLNLVAVPAAKRERLDN
jgi:FkbM family methyltransferase